MIINYSGIKLVQSLLNKMIILLFQLFQVAERMRKEDPETFNILTRCIDSYCHHQSAFPRMEAQRTPISFLPNSQDVERICYNNSYKSPDVIVPDLSLNDILKAKVKLGKMLDAEENQHWFKLRPGTVLFFDNYRLLHGRSSFTGSRRLFSCYLPRDDWLSMAAELGKL